MGNSDSRRIDNLEKLIKQREQREQREQSEKLAEFNELFKNFDSGKIEYTFYKHGRNRFVFEDRIIDLLSFVRIVEATKNQIQPVTDFNMRVFREVIRRYEDIREKEQHEKELKY